MRGVQRVSTLLLFNPIQQLQQLNLEEYTVLDCDPLHDLKGHLGNLFKELPYILPENLQKTCEDIIKANTHEKMTEADYRMVLIETYLYLLETNISTDILLLVETILCLSQILYLPEKERTPRRILQMYICSWLHHELCSKHFQRFHGDLSRNKFFGLYLHALVVHAPAQLEIISLRSVNTENQERIFSQLCKTAMATSNRQPQNVVSSTILRLQGKTEHKHLDRSSDM